MSWLAEPWQTDLVTRSAIALVIVGVLGGVVGVFVIVRDLAFATEAFAHTAFPGAVLAAAAGGSILLGGLAAVIVAAIAIALAARAERVSDEGAISVVFTGLFAAGAIALSVLGPLDRDVTSFLFGSLLGTTNRDLVVLAGATVLILAALWAMRRPLVATSFDADSATAAGMRARHVEVALLVIVGLSVVVAFQTVGNMLVLAMFITPAAAARMLTRRLSATLAVAAALGVVAGIVGVYWSYYAATAAGASVVLVATGLLIVALVVGGPTTRGRSVATGAGSR